MDGRGQFDGEPDRLVVWQRGELEFCHGATPLGGYAVFVKVGRDMNLLSHIGRKAERLQLV